MHAGAGVEGWALAPDKSGLSEVLNVAYAKHELFGGTTGQMLDWLEVQQQGGRRRRRRLAMLGDP